MVGLGISHVVPRFLEEGGLSFSLSSRRLFPYWGAWFWTAWWAWEESSIHVTC